VFLTIFSQVDPKILKGTTKNKTNLLHILIKHSTKIDDSFKKVFNLLVNEIKISIFSVNNKKETVLHHCVKNTEHFFLILDQLSN